MRVSVGDARLFFDVHGAKLRPSGPWLEERPTVVVVHTGPGVDHAPYKDHIGPRLAEVAQVVYLDQRGHGRSDASEAERWTVDQWAADLKAFCDALRIERPVVVGAGWGGYAVLRYAARWPAHPAKLVLYNPNARFVADRCVAVYDRLGDPIAGEAAHQFFERPDELTFAEYLRRCYPLWTREPMDPDTIMRPLWNFELIRHWFEGEARRIDLRPELERVAAPTLVLVAEDDPIAPAPSVDEVVEALPRHLVRIVRSPRARHSFRDDPALIDAVDAFVQEAPE